MFIHNINPVIVSLGPVAIRWYSLAYILGFLLTYWWLVHLAKTKSIENLSVDRVEEFVILAIIGVIVGGRFFEFIFYQFDVLLSDPLEIFRIWNGGMSFHGGLIGISLSSWYFSRKYKISLLALGDALAVPAAFALFFGRIANFINAELWGKATTGSPWFCVDYSRNEFMGVRPEGCRHPSQLYEALKNLFITGVLLFMWRRERQPGLIMWLFISLYGLLRFLVNFWRDDAPVFLGLSMGQLLSLVMFFVAVAGVFVVSRKK